jgi:DNA-binding Lrp family transcriptional regulator
MWRSGDPCKIGKFSHAAFFHPGVFYRLIIACLLRLCGEKLRSDRLCMVKRSQGGTMSTRSAGNALIDDCDRRILAALVRNARISFKKLAEIAQLSGNATAERVQRLQQMSVITGFKAELNRKLLGQPLQAYIDIKLQRGASMAGFEREAVSLTGAFDALIRVDCEGPEALGKLIEEIRKQAGVQETSSTVVCRELQVQTLPSRDLQGKVELIEMPLCR